MLIRFRLKNHRSFKDEQELSLVASDVRDAGFGFLESPAIAEKLLPVAGIYGANASGKSNLHSAIGTAAGFVERSHNVLRPSERIPIDPFALIPKPSDRSEFEFEFIEQDVRYCYGFELSTKQVEEEWLYAWPRGRIQTWFERTRNKFSFGKHLTGEREVIRTLTRPNSLFVSVGAQNNHPQLSLVHRWVDRVIPSPDASFSLHDRLLRQFSSSFESDERMRRLLDEERPSLLRLLRSADLGIDEFRFQGVEGVRTGRAESLLEFRHRGSKGAGGWLPLDEESDGTRMILDHALVLIPVLRTGGVVIIDELERHLHPSLAIELIRMFQDPRVNVGRAQLIFTTHDTNLIGRVHEDSPILRRDQVWFTEKDESGASALYPLTDFHPRKEENLERGYLQGRYGAVPYLGGFRDAGWLARDGYDAPGKKRVPRRPRGR